MQWGENLQNVTRATCRLACLFAVSNSAGSPHFLHFQVLYFLVIHFQRPSSPTQKIARIAPSVSIAANSPSTSREFLDLMKKIFDAADAMTLSIMPFKRLISAARRDGGHNEQYCDRSH